MQFIWGSKSYKVNKLRLTFCLFFSITSILNGQNWEFITGGPQEDKGFDIQQTIDGGFIVVGSTQSFATDTTFQHVFVVKLNGSLEEEWSKILAYPGSFANRCRGVIQLEDEQYILATITDPGNLFADLNLIKLSETGEEVWSKLINPSLNIWPFDIEKTTDGNLVVTGYRSSVDSLRDVFIFKIDDDGNKIWESFYGTEEVEAAVSIKESSDGGFILSGNFQDESFDDEDFLTIKTNHSGEVEWMQIDGLVNDTTDIGDEAQSAIQVNDGGFVTAGHWDVGKEIAVIKYDSEGNEEWKTFLNQGGDANRGGFLAEDTEGNIAVIGDNYQNIYLMLLSQGGNFLTHKAIVTTSGEGRALGMCQTVDGGYAITGQVRYPDNQKDLLVIRTDMYGNITSQVEITLPERKVEMYPNPSKDVVNWKVSSIIPNERNKIEVYDINGALVMEKHFFEEVQISSKKIGMINGAYFYKIYNEYSDDITTGQFLIVR